MFDENMYASQLAVSNIYTGLWFGTFFIFPSYMG